MTSNAVPTMLLDVLVNNKTTSNIIDAALKDVTGQHEIQRLLLPICIVFAIEVGIWLKHIFLPERE